MQVTMTAREWRAMIAPITTAKPRVGVLLVRIDAADGMVTATTNRDNTIIRSIAYGDVVESGSVCLPAIGLSEFVRHCTSQTLLTLRLDGSQAIATADTARHVFEAQTPDAVTPYPDQSRSYTTEIALSGSQFAAGVKAVSYAAATDQYRPALAAIMIDAAAPQPTMTAADGYRMSRQRIDVVARTGSAAQILLPIDIVGSAMAMAQESDSLVTISVDDQSLNLTVGRHSMTTPIITSRYPDIDRVLPKTQPVARAHINSRVIIASLKRVISAHPKEQYCHVSIDAGELTITSPAGTTVSLSSTTEGSANIAINPKFFHSAVYGADGDVSLSVYEEANKSLVVERDGYYALVALFARR